MLDGKVVVLTGGSKGLGPHLAEALVKAGARVAVLARASAELDETAAALGQAARAIVCDVADPDSVGAAFREAQAAFGRIDILVNNAAVAQLNTLETISDEDVRREVGVNFIGPIFCMREAIPHMREAGGGHIVNVSSLGVRVPGPFLSLYSATKGGLETLSMAARDELKPHNIRVSVLRLGAIRTGVGLARSWSEEKKDLYLRQAKEAGLMKRVGAWMSPQSVAHVLIQVLTAPEDTAPDLIELVGR